MLAVTLIVAPQLLGGVHGWAVAVIATLAALSVILATWAFSHKVRLHAVPPVIIALLVVLAWTALQATPLPCSWVAVVAPASADASALSSEALGAPIQCALSRDPGETRRYVVMGAALLAVFLAAWLAAAAGHRRIVLLISAASVLAMTVVALGHALAGVDAVFGLYEPLHARPRVLAPLLNGNHLAGFLVMGVPLLVALGLASEDPGRRAMWMCATACATAVALMTLSRGGLVALALASIALALVLGRRASHEGQRRGLGIPLAVGTVGAGLALGLYVAADALQTEVASSDASKLELIGAALGLAFDNPLIGVGRGGFSAAFVEQMGTNERFVYAENFVAQWAGEWGVPAAAFLMFALGTTWARGFRTLHDLAPRAALIGVAAIATQNLVDYSLEMLGVATVAIAIFAAATAPARRSGTDSKPSPDSPSRIRITAAAAAATAALVTAFLGPSLHADSVDSLQARLTAELRDEQHERFAETLRTAMDLHPSEPGFALLAGAEARRREDPSALRWLTRAMQLAPHWAGPHVEAAWWLSSHGHVDQSLLEIREAARLDLRATEEIVCSLLTSRQDASLVIQAAPPDGERTSFLDMAGGCVDLDSPAGARIDEEIVNADPTMLGPRLRRARRFAAADDTDAALAEIEHAIEGTPASIEAHALALEILVAGGRAEDALDRASRASGLEGDPTPLLEQEARARVALGDDDGMREVLQEIIAQAGDSAHRLGRAHHLLGMLEEQSGNRRRALAAFQEAHDFGGERRSLIQVAVISEHLGDRDRAYLAWTEVCRLWPENQRACSARDRLRGRSLNVSP